MSNLNEIGAVWKRTGKTGEYFTGSVMLNGVAYEIRIFKNDYKKLDKHPDMKVFLATPDDQPASAPSEPTISHNDRTASVLPDYPEEPLDPNDIPF